MFFLTQNPCTPPYKPPVISLSFFITYYSPVYSLSFFIDKQGVLKKCQKQSAPDFQNFPKFIFVTKVRKKINVKKCDILMARSLRSLAAVLYGEYRDFKSERTLL